MPRTAAAWARKERGDGGTTAWLSPGNTAAAVTVVGYPLPRHTAARLTPRERLRATTTPRKLRRLLVGLVVLSLIWGAVAAWVVSQRASGAGDVVSTSEPRQPGRPADLPGAVGRGRHRGDRVPVRRPGADRRPASLPGRHRPGGLPPGSRHGRSRATRPPPGTWRCSRRRLPVYTGEVETARADNRLGLPLGAAYLREASSLMRGTLLPAARDVSAQADAQLAADSGRATGLPLAVLLLASAVLVGSCSTGAQRWLFAAHSPGAQCGPAGGVRGRRPVAALADRRAGRGAGGTAASARSWFCSRWPRSPRPTSRRFRLAPMRVSP